MTDEWIKKLWYMYAMEYYSFIKKEQGNAICSTWKQLEILLLSEVSQKEQDKYPVISLVCGVQNMAPMDLSTKQK